jgi:tRNA uridine 5-carbamoylmethylation protein Kti12
MKRFVIAITGPTGSGKTTIGEKLAKRLERCVNIDTDHLKHMVPSGFYEDPESPSGKSYSEWGLLGDTAGLMVANYLKMILVWSLTGISKSRLGQQSKNTQELITRFCFCLSYR